MALFIGVWEGDVNVPSGVPMHNLLTSATVNGKTKATARVRGPASNYFLSSVDFLKSFQTITRSRGEPGAIMATHCYLPARRRKRCVASKKAWKSILVMMNSARG